MVEDADCWPWVTVVDFVVVFVVPLSGSKVVETVVLSATAAPPSRFERSVVSVLTQPDSVKRQPCPLCSVVEPTVAVEPRRARRSLSAAVLAPGSVSS